MINVLNLNLMIHFHVLEKILSGDGTSSYKLYYITITHKYVFYIFILLLVIYFTILPTNIYEYNISYLIW